MLIMCKALGMLKRVYPLVYLAIVQTYGQA